MGQEFDQTMKFTTTRLLELNLSRYKELINTVCNGASHEHELEVELQQLIRSWLERDFKLAKHIPSMRPRKDAGHSKKTSEKQKEKKRKMTLHEVTMVIFIHSNLVVVVQYFLRVCYRIMDYYLVS